MSLVEQAAKRLEQLRKAAAETAAEAPQTTSDAQPPSSDNASTVERMVRRMESPAAEKPRAPAVDTWPGQAPGATAPDGLPVPRHAAPDSPALRADMQGAADLRREPVLGDVAD